MAIDDILFDPDNMNALLLEMEEIVETPPLPDLLRDGRTGSASKKATRFYGGYPSKPRSLGFLRR